MSTITEVATAFFDACETGKGWAVCNAYCTPDASFSAQAEPLGSIKTVQAYTEWMKNLLMILPDGSYATRAFATDEERRTVMGYAVFSGTHSGAGGPVPPTGRRTDTDYVYVMQFDRDKICHMTKIWNSGETMRELGW